MSAFQTLPEDVQEKAAQQLLRDILKFNVLKSEIAKGRADSDAGRVASLVMEEIITEGKRLHAAHPSN